MSRAGSVPVHVAAMSDPHDVDDEASIEDLVDDPVVADAHPVGVVFAGELAACGWVRIVGEEVDGGADPLLFPAWQRCERSDGSASDLDLVLAHVRPSSAFTSSQGT